MPRSRRRSADGSSYPRARIKCVAQSVAHEVDAQDREHDGEAGEEGPPPVALLDEVERVGEDVAPSRLVQFDAEADEAHERLPDDDAGHAEGRRDDDRREG